MNKGILCLLGAKKEAYESHNPPLVAVIRFFKK